MAPEHKVGETWERVRWEVHTRGPNDEHWYCPGGRSFTTLELAQKAMKQSKSNYFDAGGGLIIHFKDEQKEKFRYRIVKVESKVTLLEQDPE